LEIFLKFYTSFFHFIAIKKKIVYYFIQNKRTIGMNYEPVLDSMTNILSNKESEGVAQEGMHSE
jgi:hypothetical protein